MASAVISAIMDLLKFGKTIYDLYEANNAEDTITLADAVRLTNSVNVRLFAGNEFARIQTARDRFYTVYLPSITMQSEITQADVTGGFLTQTYQNIRSEGDAVWESLQKLNWIFTNNALHVDDYNFFARLIAQGHILLLHMHSVILNLRSLEIIGRVDLDHPQLLPETLMLASYLRVGLQQVTDMDARVRGLRLGQISDVSTRLIRGAHNMTHRLYSWRDSYAKLSSTDADQAINGDKVPSHYADQSDIYHDPYSKVVDKRTERVDYIQDIYNTLTGDLIAELAEQQKDMRLVIDERLKQQRNQSIMALLKAWTEAAADESAVKASVEAERSVASA